MPTFRSGHFLSYEGGHTLMFTERCMYLQEEQQSEILDSFADYVSPSGEWRWHATVEA